jgi:hypothetical protein
MSRRLLQITTGPLALDAPPVRFIAFTVLELVGPPLFIYWQHRVATAAAPHWTR